MLTVCPHCRAENEPDVARCWMCGETLGAAEIVEAEAVGPGDERSGASYILTALLAIVALVAVGVGLWKEAPGLSILLCVVAAPAVLMTLGWIFRRRRRGETITVGKAALDFFVSAAIMVFMAFIGVGVLGICAIVLIFMACSGARWP